MGRGPHQPTRGSGERRELPQRGPERSPSRKRFLSFISLRRTPPVALCRKLAARQQTSAGARSWLTVENFIIITEKVEQVDIHSSASGPESDTEGSRGVKIFICNWPVSNKKGNGVSRAPPD